MYEELVKSSISFYQTRLSHILYMNKRTTECSRGGSRIVSLRSTSSSSISLRTSSAFSDLSVSIPVEFGQ